MEAGDDPAGDRHKEQGNDRGMFAAEFCRLKRFRFLKQCRILESQPQQHHKNSRRTHQQHRCKERVDRADDLIHGEQSRHHIVHKNRPYTDPEVVVSGQKSVAEVCRDIDKYRHHQQKQDHHEPGEDTGIPFAQIVTDDLRQVGAFVPE